ncbi:intron Large complex component GCFC2 isoform X2 [Antennarius striatus]|uniref:intron Large complex component GCFC2 isoform X2 n=1 Tax=Antennarius striatus TaxID=241820 RepID=UPI0035B34D76
MFNKKPRRNFRQRKCNSSDEEDKQKNSGGEEEEENAQAVVHKPFNLAQGRGISCSSKREATPPKAGSSDGEDAETLEAKEEVDERKKGNYSIKKNSNSILSFSEDKEAEEPTFKLKKSSEKAVVFQVRKKEVSHAKATQHAGKNIEPQDYDSQTSPCALQQSDHNEGDDSDNDNDDDGISSSSVSSMSDTSISSTKLVIIPNAEEIQAARKKRRATRSQKNFIPLDRDGQSSAGSTPDHYSREDDEDRVEDVDESDDHERRIQFAPRSKSLRERIAEKIGGSDDSLSGTDEEEQELWEETQIEKGVKRHPGGRSPSGSESSSYSSSNINRQEKRQKKASARVRIPKTLPLISVTMVKKKIAGKLDSLKEVHRARQAELRRMEGDVENASSSLEILAECSSESQLKFYRAMTFYVHNLVECLREKVVEINSLELELHVLLSDQMGVLLARRRHRVKEQFDHLQQLSCTDDQSGDSANGTQGKEDNDVKTEEDFDIPDDTQLSAEEDDELQKKKADILLRSQVVFSDVQDEFCDVKKILCHFEEWRGSYSESYHNAYISLCLPKLLNPIIRLQLLPWNPLEDSIQDCENLPWFTAVETFCHGHGHEELEDTDRQTLCTVIERNVLPKMTAYVELAWDPVSRQQTDCLSDICHRLKEDYSIFEGEQSKPVKAFIEAVIGRLRNCVDEDIFIPLYPKKFVEDRTSPQCRFRDQQFLTAIKLLTNMGKWDLLLPEVVLKELMLDKLLNRYLMITLCSQTLHSIVVMAYRKIAGSLPLSWLKGETVCLPQLHNLRNHLVQKVHTICKQQPPDDPNTRSAVVELLQILSTIRCNDSIMAIAEKYHYEDVIYSHQLLNQEND